MDTEKIQELITMLKTKKEELEDEEFKKALKICLIVLLCAAGVGILIFVLYKYFSPDYLDDEDDFEDEDVEE
ncbi:MAG: hypothetical protein ACOX78_02870 [Lachnospiraceae bacterium]|jgi:preprotein translocase subunit Sss1